MDRKNVKKQWQAKPRIALKRNLFLQNLDDFKGSEKIKKKQSFAIFPLNNGLKIKNNPLKHI